ncbi:MAG: hypothetical protein A3K16_05650 [Omnitrophica bacterium RIFCSPLOWO2_01_FULL_45_24]|uniref:DUF2283 domain-containing protein n=1 Tax=Candidatus Uhrbacteria bacterium RIFCSPLOWO2_02_FULL_48_12 TaxID=1802407 RepID=A0A1F7VA75_9BACT|nr:MAG: hypothetical protein A3I40_02560 [Candidatus Uhrbacteria bacterium RIFCSPLOWO2_02_FULL_48_12]OGW93869.1 MAG: hypothetical protein A3K16_05650 [Omnitrophica bacterium RIFCSPLOWO2_01_FULL_45_24]
MQITYDKEVDALNVSLRPGIVSRTLEIAPEILLDVDKKGNPLYLEIIGASEKIGKKNFGKVIVGKKFLHLPSFA